MASPVATTTKPNSASAAAVRIVRNHEGETHAVMGDPMRFIMTAEQTGGAYALAEQTVRHGNGAPPHIHHREDETFYMLEGEVVVTIDGQEQRLRAGDFAHVPRGRVRSFRSDTPGGAAARVLIHHCPGSAAGFYIGMGQLPFPPDMDDVARLCTQYGIELVR